jgi:hypothetical protein
VKLGGDPLGRLLGAVEHTADEDVRATTFVRGLALGALVGAAIAGSTIWQRRHGRLVKRPADVASAAPLASTTNEPPSQPG